MKKEQKKVIPIREQNANEFTDVKDIAGNFLVTRSGYLFAYLRIFSFNLELLSKEECQLLTQKLSLSFESDRGDFTYFSFPREIDLDQYKNFLKQLYQRELNNLGKRQLLSVLMKTAQSLSTSGENYEHQHFIKIWQSIDSNEAEAKRDLLERIRDFKSRFDVANIRSKVLEEQEIIKICNLFGNSEQVTYDTGEVNTLYSPIPQLH